MSKKKKTTNVGTIKGVDLLLNSANKMGAHDPLVRTGTGIHKSKKQYDRKGKKNQQRKNELKKYRSGAADSFSFRAKSKHICILYLI